MIEQILANDTVQLRVGGKLTKFRGYKGTRKGITENHESFYPRKFLAVRYKVILNEYCYAARGTFAKLKVIVTCTYSNLFARCLKTISFKFLWKAADHHGTIECMIDVLGNR